MHQVSYQYPLNHGIGNVIFAQNGTKWHFWSLMYLTPIIHIGSTHYRFSRVRVSRVFYSFVFGYIATLKFVQFVARILDKFPRKGFLWTATIRLALTAARNTMGHQAHRARPCNCPTRRRIASNLKT